MKRLAPLVLSAFILSATPAFATEAGLDVQVGTPVAGSVPKGAQRVPLLTLSMEAGCDEDVVVSEIIVKHSGLGDADDLSRVYVTQGNKRLSRAATFSGEGENARLRLRSFTIDKCTKEVLAIVVDFSPDAAIGAQHRLNIEKNGIVADTDSIMITSGSNGPVTTVPGPIGTIEVSYPPLTRTVTYGPNRVVGRISLEADELSDHAISSITLTNNGTARSTDLKNLRVRLSNGEYVGSTESSLDGDSVTFTFDPPLLLERNQTRLLNVVADVRASNRRTIGLEVEESSDIQATVRKQRGGRFQ